MDAAAERVVVGVDEFIYWAKRFTEWSAVDAHERDCKLSLAERLAAARRLFFDTSDDWVEGLRQAIMPKDNKFTTFHLHTPLLEWTNKDPAAARTAVGRGRG